MISLARGVVEDLRRRRLLPVALALVAGLVAAPVLLLEESEPVPSSSATPAAPVAGADPAAPPGLEQVQQAGQKPLVSLAVLSRSSSDLESFKSKNPFKPLERIGVVGDAGGSGSGVADIGGGASGGSQDGGTASGGGADGGTSLGGGAPGGSGGDLSPTPDPSPPSSTKPDEPPRKLTYAVDLTYAGPEGERRYRKVTKLRMLPTESAPLLIFLGVDASGDKAVFLLDTTLHAVGSEGSCSPSRDQCATISLEPGDLGAFVDDQGKRYEILIEQIRATSVLSAARAARRKRARASEGERRRFMPPVITDLLSGGQR